jgi:hypothetical protein
MFELIYRFDPADRVCRHAPGNSDEARIPLTEDEKGLFQPPENEEGFHELAEQICTGPLIRTLLSQSPN